MLLVVDKSLGLLSIGHLRLVVNEGSLHHGLVVSNGGNLLVLLAILVLLREVVHHAIVVDAARVSSVPGRVVSMGGVENVGISFSLSLGVSLDKMTVSLGTKMTLVEHIEGVLVSHAGKLVGHGLVMVVVSQELSGGRGKVSHAIVDLAIVPRWEMSVSLVVDIGVRLGCGESQKRGQNL